MGRFGCGARRPSSWRISPPAYLLDIIAARDLIWLIVGAVTIVLAAAWALPPLATRTSGSRK
jgi:hypothetical protein